MSMNIQAGGETDVDGIEKQNAVQRCSTGCQRGVHTFFYNLGFFCGKYYKTTIFASIVTYFIFSSCVFLLQETENRAERLWVAQDTDSRRDYDYVSDTWDNEQSAADFVMAVVKGDNVLTGNAMRDWNEVHQGILAVNVSVNYDEFPGMWDYNRKCLKAGEFCQRSTILDIFDVNQTLIDSLTDNNVLTRTNDDQYWFANTGASMTRTQVMGGTEGEAPSITSSQALLSVYNLYLDEIIVDDRRNDPVQDEWELTVRDFLQDYQSQNIELYYSLRAVWAEEFRKLISSDFSKIVMSYSIIIVYAALCLGKRNSIRSGIGLAFASVFSVVMAMYVSYGISAIFGVFFTPLHNSLAFLLLALGVDDAFVIVYEYAEVLKTLTEEDLKQEDSVPHIMGAALSKAGHSIMLTSFTDFFVFMLGATTVLPALSSFCIYAGLGVFVVFIYQTTFFISCLTINHYRVASKRRDICCCCTTEDEPDTRCCYVCPKENPQFLQVVFETLARLVSNNVVAIVICLMSLVFVCFGIFGLVIRDTEFDILWFVPKDSSPKLFFDAQKEYFHTPIRVGFYVKDIDYFGNQEDMVDLHTTITTSQYIDQAWPVRDWHQEYLTWANNGGLDTAYLTDGLVNDETTYYDSLQSWLDGDGDIYAQNVLWDGDRIKASYATASFKGKYAETFGEDRYNAMVGLRDEVDGVAPTSFAFTYQFIYWEEFGFIKTELLRNIIICITVIIVTVFSLIDEKRTACCVIVAIVFAVLDVAGFGTFWGLDYNGITTTYTLIALGLTVDYSIHIGHKFGVATGTAEERIAKTMTVMGPPVFHGAMSTFLAVLVLASAETYIFQVFFKMFFLVSMFGGFHGMVVLPAFFRLVGVNKDEKVEPTNDGALVSI